MAIFYNLSPDDGATGVSHTTDIAFDILDPFNGVNINSLDVYINGAAAVFDGVVQDGYSLNISAVSNGYSVHVWKDDPYNNLEQVSVYAYVENSIGDPFEIEYSFRIVGDGELPVFSNFDPEPFSIDQSRDQDVSFDLTIENDVGIDYFNVYLNFYPAVINSVAQDGYTLSTSNITNGYSVSVGHEPFSGRIYVGLEAVSLDGYSDGYEYYYDVDPNIPKVKNAIVGPFNNQVTLTFTEYLRQDSTLTSPSTYLFNYGAYVDDVEADPTQTDQVILTVENFYGYEEWELTVAGDITGLNGNIIDDEHRVAIVYMENTGAAISGYTGKLKTRNQINKVAEDDTFIYFATTGGLDVVRKYNLDNEGYVQDGYGYNAIAVGSDTIYMGSSDGYNEDPYGVMSLSRSNIIGNSLSSVNGLYGSPDMPSNNVNDISESEVGLSQVIAVGTDLGAVVFTDGYGVRYSDYNDISKALVTTEGHLYLVNDTYSQIEVFYSVQDRTINNEPADAIYSISSAPGLSDSVINDLDVATRWAEEDGYSLIAVATNFGVTLIHADETNPGSSESSGTSITYGTAGSGLDYGNLGGTANRAVAVSINVARSQLFVGTQEDGQIGGLSMISLATGDNLDFKSYSAGTLISENITNLSFKSS